MTLTRQMTFWVLTFVVGVLVLYVLREILLPFVAGMALAYLLDHPCVDCGEDDPIVLEFDHLRDKRVNVSALANSAVPFDRVLAEIEKCEVVCANCHRRRTCTRLDSYRVRMLREFLAERRGA